MHGIITLTTDFGLGDPFVGVMKGAILARFRKAQLVDLTHAILPHWPAEAAFWLARSYRYFPPGTVHVAVVDPGVGTQRAIAVVEAEGHVFLAPDNGLLAPLVERAAKPKIRRLDLRRLEFLQLSAASATFHGRDIFAPVAAELAAKRLHPADLGDEAQTLEPSGVDEPSAVEGRVTGVVMTVDHFGNLITNIDASWLGRFQRPVVIVGGQRLPIYRTYGDRPPGQYLALVNAFEVLEIARTERNAAAGLGLGRGAFVTVEEGEGA